VHFHWIKYKYFSYLAAYFLKWLVNFVSELNTTCEEDVPVHEWNCEFLTRGILQRIKKGNKKAFKPLSKPEYNLV
jgi:hypothetical protein